MRPHDGGMQRLVEVGAGNRDEILDAAGDRMPFVVDHAERGVAVLHRIGKAIRSLAAAHGSTVTGTHRVTQRPSLHQQRPVVRDEADEPCESALHFRHRCAGERNGPTRESNTYSSQ